MDISDAPTRKVMVSGCFDLLHSGHVAFLQEAAALDALHVCIGSDETVCRLKGRYPVTSQAERQFMLEALACVSSVRVSRGRGLLDFQPEMTELQPDIFFVNEDGHTPEKAALCQEHGIQYLVARRQPATGLVPRSTTDLRKVCTIPYRIDLAGGWLDQPWVSGHAPGPVLTVSIEPTHDFNLRSGMATSTRQKARELWPGNLPAGDPGKTAQLLFAYENPPGTTEVAGSQDAIGIVFPGLNKLYYAGKYWPEYIESVQEERVLAWLENHLYLIALGPRDPAYRALADTNITFAGALALANAAEGAWSSALRQGLHSFGHYCRASFEAQIAMFPHMVDDHILQLIGQYRDQALGWKLSGAGGGGYLVLVSKKPVANAIQIRIRRQAGV